MKMNIVFDEDNILSGDRLEAQHRIENGAKFTITSGEAEAEGWLVLTPDNCPPNVFCYAKEIHAQPIFIVATAGGA